MQSDKRLLWRVAACAVALAAVSAPALAHSSKHKGPTTRHLTGSLDVCDFGAFFVGGVPKLTQYANSINAGVYQELIIGQMYVQFMIPNSQRGWPLIMVHGGGYSGSGLESTPDGHEGWFAYSVRNKNATYVVDQAGRGRSGFDRSFIHERIGTGNLTGFPSLAVTSANGIWTGWFGHLVPSGSDITTGLLIKHGDPQDPQCVANPDHCTFGPAHNFDAVDPDIEARVGAIGPAPNPDNNRQLALEHYKWGVPNTNATLPTSTCSTCTPNTVNPADTWSGQDLAKLVVKLGGAIVATHSQSGSVGHHMVRYLKEGGNLSKLKALITIDGVGVSFASSGTAPEDYLKIPYMALLPYYPGLSTTAYQTMVDGINGAGGKAQLISLSDPVYGDKFKGVTHMMMMGIGHLDVFDVIQKWVGKNVPGSSKKVSCARANNRGDPEDFEDDDDRHHGRH